MGISFSNWWRRPATEHGAVFTADRRRAQAALDRGATAESAGAPADAIQHYRDAVAIDPTFAAAHFFLGTALHATGDARAALVSFEQAIRLGMHMATAHYNAGLSHLALGHAGRAEASFRAALAMRNEFPEAWVGLAASLEALQRPQDALTALDTAIGQRGEYVGALFNSVSLLRTMGRTDLAIERCRRVLALEPENADAHSELGACLLAHDRWADAEKSYRLALALRPNFAPAQFNLAVLLLRRRRHEEALALLFAAVAASPSNPDLRALLADTIAGAQSMRLDAIARTALTHLCEYDDISTWSHASAIVAVLKCDAGFKALLGAARADVDPFANPDSSLVAFMSDQLVLAALPRMVLPDADIERALTHARRWILLRSDPASGGTPDTPRVPLPFVCALARHCFCNGYAWFVEAAELKCLQRLRDFLDARVSQAGKPVEIEDLLAVAALYGALSTSAVSERLLQMPAVIWSAPFGAIVFQQLVNPKREHEIAAGMRRLTTIQDEVSAAVQSQYEEHPYPVWTGVQRVQAEALEQVRRRLGLLASGGHRTPARILVAGCGTGHQAVAAAMNYRDTQVVAVDLSVASLAYAVRMTQQLGIDTIEYAQADILELGGWEERFAIIECAGVLHHLGDPLHGWRVLLGLLEPGGLMKIALYSACARRGLEQTRRLIRASAAKPTTDGIRACRREIMRLPPEHAATAALGFTDFFALSSCRDLLLHAQERVYSLPQIEECLRVLGLRFLGMECKADVRDAFAMMFPNPDALLDLAAWDRFEQAYPDTFKAMYTFWCCRA